MQDDTTASGDDQTQAELEQSTETDAKGPSPEARHVSHQTYRKTVEAEKAAKARARDFEAKFNELNEKLLAESGNKDELIKSLKAKLDGESKRAKELFNSYARKSLGAQMRSAALEAGCIDPDAVMSLGDFSNLEVDAQTFEADDNEVKDIINGLKKSKPYLFQKPGPKVNSKLPSGGSVSGRIDANSMSNSEIQALLRTLK